MRRSIATAMSADTRRRAGQHVSIVMLAAAFWWLRRADLRVSAGGGLGGPVAAPHVPNQNATHVNPTPDIAFLTVVLYLVEPNTTINHLVFLFIPLAVLV